MRATFTVSLILLSFGAPAWSQDKPKKDRAEEFFQRIRFAKVEIRDDELRRIVELLKTKEHWLGAYRTLEKFGKFPDNQELSVDFTLDGEELGAAKSWGVQGQINFNIKRMAQGQRIVEDLERRRKELEAEGKKLVYLIPPFRCERVIYHELTHILQRNYAAPDWFIEGMAEYVAGEDQSIYALALSGRRIKDIEDPLSKRYDIYGRGLLFWKWLRDRGSADKTIQLSIILRKSWQEAVEEATRMSWSVIVASERDWSIKEVESKR